MSKEFKYGSFVYHRAETPCPKVPCESGNYCDKPAILSYVTEFSDEKWGKLNALHVMSDGKTCALFAGPVGDRVYAQQTWPKEVIQDLAELLKGETQ